MAGKIYLVCRDWNPDTGRRDGPWCCPCDGFKYRKECSHIIGLHTEESLRHQYAIPSETYEPVGAAHANSFLAGLVDDLNTGVLQLADLPSDDVAKLRTYLSPSVGAGVAATQQQIDEIFPYGGSTP